MRFRKSENKPLKEEDVEDERYDMSRHVVLDQHDLVSRDFPFPFSATSDRRRGARREHVKKCNIQMVQYPKVTSTRYFIDESTGRLIADAIHEE